MTNTVLLASKNQNKLAEMIDIFNLKEVKIISLAEYPDLAEVEETGKTFRANALLKARYYFDALRMPCIADDSGLVVPALDGMPGIYSARYSGGHRNYKSNNLKLLLEMAGFSGEQRYAYFVSYMVYLDEHVCLEAEGRVEGYIDIEEKGHSGFGYDPLFYYPPEKKTFGQLDEEKKNSLSHRFLALKNLSTQLRTHLTS